MKSGVGQMTDTIINQVIFELNKMETKKKIKVQVLDPVICEINKKIYPYFLTFSVLIVLILILIIIILQILVKRKQII